MTVGPVEDEEWNDDRIEMKSKRIIATTTIMMTTFMTTLLTRTVAFEEVQQTKCRSFLTFLRKQTKSVG